MNVRDGEVSPYVFNDLVVNDKVEIRGPFGKFFVWTPEEQKSVFLVAGGSGVVPMHAIFTAHEDSGSASEMKLLYSSHTFDDILYKEDFLENPNITIALTKESPKDWKGETGRITQEMLGAIVESFTTQPICYVCGMSRFVDAITEALQVAGIPASSIKTERFG